MTDTTQAPAAAETQVPTEDLTALEQNMAEFFGHRLSDPMVEDKPVETPTAAAPAETPSGAPAPVDPPAPAPNAEPAASQNEGGEPEVEADLLAEVMLGAAPSATPPQQEQPTTAAPASPSSDDELYMPIKAEQLRIPQPQLDAIFRSEDPVEQEAALRNLMAGWMNAGIAMMDKRMKDHYAPQISQRAHQTTLSAQAAAQIEQDFYGSYADLRTVPQLVERVATFYRKQDPNAKWGPELKAKIGDNARALAKKMGISLAGAPAPVAPPAQPFIADSARPNSALPTGQPDYSPAKMVDDLSMFA